MLVINGTTSTISSLQKKGKPVNMKKLHTEFKLMMKELGIDNIRIHNLRHSMASAIVNLTRDIHEAQRYLGHLRVRTTKLYLHSTVDSQKKLQDGLIAFLNLINCIMKYGLSKYLGHFLSLC